MEGEFSNLRIEINRIKLKENFQKLFHLNFTFYSFLKCFFSILFFYKIVCFPHFLFQGEKFSK